VEIQSDISHAYYETPGRNRLVQLSRRTVRGQDLAIYHLSILYYCLNFALWGRGKSSQNKPRRGEARQNEQQTAEQPQTQKGAKRYS